MVCQRSRPASKPPSLFQFEDSTYWVIACFDWSIGELIPSRINLMAPIALCRGYSDFLILLRDVIFGVVALGPFLNNGKCFEGMKLWGHLFFIITYEWYLSNFHSPSVVRGSGYWDPRAIYSLKSNSKNEKNKTNFFIGR